MAVNKLQQQTKSNQPGGGDDETSTTPGGGGGGGTTRIIHVMVTIEETEVLLSLCPLLTEHTTKKGTLTHTCTYIGFCQAI